MDWVSYSSLYQLPSVRRLIKDWGNEAQRCSFRDNNYLRWNRLLRRRANRDIEEPRIKKNQEIFDILFIVSIIGSEYYS